MSPYCEADRTPFSRDPAPLEPFLGGRGGGRGVLCERSNVQPRHELGARVTAAVAANGVWQQQDCRDTVGTDC